MNKNFSVKNGIEIGVADGTAPIITTSTTKVVNLNSDKLDDHEGSYYLDWTNTTNKPDPTITVTLTGDVTGTGNSTLTDLGNGTISLSTSIANLSVNLTSDVSGTLPVLNGGTGTTTSTGTGNNVLSTSPVFSTNINTDSATFSIANTTATTLNIGGAAETINIGSSTGNTFFNGTNGIKLPAGNTAQRPGTPSVGHIRYNTEISSFEGFGPGSAWGSLGGVKDVDGDTYIIPEISAGSDEDTLKFYNGGINTANISTTSASFNIPISSSTFNSTGTGAIKVSVGTTAQRPSGAVGLIRYNSDLSIFEGYTSIGWGAIGGADIHGGTF